MSSPESLGLVPGTIYVISVCLLQLLLVHSHHLPVPTNGNGGIGNGATLPLFVEFNAGLFTTCFMLYLGFADDVLNLRWRYKLVLPTLCTLPLLLAYQGPTEIVIPVALRPLLNGWGITNTATTIELGILYYIYMLMVTVFCSNSINILAGVNGLEVGQSLIIGCSVLIHNCIELDGAYRKEHMFSLVCMLPFIANCCGLLFYNWYPSQVFVGDTFTYFAGITLAVSGVLGHFSKTLMLFFIPQVINFVISIPQLFGIVPCPRHRVPRFDERDGKMHNSGNYTLLNLILFICGPLHERTLTIVTLALQVACCAFGFFVRYKLSSLYYDE